MTWNYRVIKHRDMLEIYEVYYNKKGEIIGVTEDPASPGGETLEELQEDMEHYAAALKRPMLIMEEIVFGDHDE
jgi:hypothetical protein